MSLNPKFAANVREAFPEAADQVLGLIDGTIDPESFASVQTWIRQCYTRPSAHELRACALNEALGMNGVEAVFESSDSTQPILEYLNAGDTYAATLTYRTDRWTWRVSTMGDEIERLERAGITVS